MKVQISLEEVGNELGVFLSKDGNGLLYFKETGEKQITMSPYGGVVGFEKIEIFEKVIVCHKLSQLFNVFLRGTKRWLSYVPMGRHDEQFDFYDKNPKLIADDFILLYLEGGRGQEHACFVFEMDCFIPMPGNSDQIGLFEEIPVVQVAAEGKIIILSRDKRKSVFCPGFKQFRRIPSPAGYEKEDFQYEFLHVQPTYVVLKKGGDFEPDFFVFSLIDSEYKNIYMDHVERLDAKYWKPRGVVCTEDHIALCYLSTTPPCAEEWQVMPVKWWKPVTKVFTLSFEADVFDDVSLDEKTGEMILSKEINRSARVTIPKRD